MSIFNRKRKLPLIDLWDYFARVLLAVDKGYEPMPPDCFDLRESKKDYTAAEWETMERNLRVAEELYQYAKLKLKEGIIV
jgi:hypothetical protein